MKKTSLISALILASLILMSNRASAYPIPTFSPSEIAQQISTYMTAAHLYNSEVYSTKTLVIESVIKGVPGYIKSIEQGDFTGLAKGVATDAFNTYMADAMVKQKAKKAAEAEAQKNAQQKLVDQQEGEEAAQKAVEENRNKAAENKKNFFKKAYSWGKTQATKVGTKLNADDGKLARGLKSYTGFLGDETGNKANKLIDTLSKQGNSNTTTESGSIGGSGDGGGNSASEGGES